MKILVTGNGRSGSWQIRGAQLGAAIGADVQAGAQMVNGYDLVVMIKRPLPHVLHRLHEAGARIVWDVVDAWPQPEGNRWGKDQAMAWMAEELKKIKPYAVVAATKAMAEDLRQIGVQRVLALPHHARPDQLHNPIRDKIVRIGYEGAENYVAAWRKTIEFECRRRGWQFVVNPQHLAEVDVVVAVRDQQGYPARMWKSNVKLANAQATATPIIACQEAGYLETASGGELWADTDEQFRLCLLKLTSQSDRRRIAVKLTAADYSLPTVAGMYKQWLEGIA